MRALTCLVLPWLAAAGIGLLVLAAYDGAPVDPGTQRSSWPAAAERGRGSRGPWRWTLAALRHPRCVCTAATLNELSRILARTGERLDATVLFVRPPGEEQSFEHTSAWDAALAIPGVVHVGGHRPDYGAPVCLLREARHQLAYLQTVQAGGDRLESAPHLGGGLRLGVPGLVLRRPPDQVEKDAGAGPAK